MYQLKSGKRFKCQLVEERDSYKLVKWEAATYGQTKDPVKQFTFGDIEIFEPKSISLRRINKSLVATIKSSTSKYYGCVSQNWVLWYLTQMRLGSLIHLILNNGKFSNGYVIDQGNFGPCCVNYQTHPNYAARCIRTYLDNKKKFFFA